MEAVPYPGFVRCAVIVDGNVVATDRPEPEPGPGEVLVRVAGAGLNRADLVQRAGFYPAPPGSPPDIPGLEFSGTVVARGPLRPREADHGLHAGDRVFGIAGGGAQAEQLVVPGTHCAPVPDSLDLLVAGGVPEVFVTAHDAMVTRAGVRPGDWVLIHTVGSGVGTAAVQLATAFGARTIGTRAAPTSSIAAGSSGSRTGSWRRATATARSTSRRSRRPSLTRPTGTAPMSRSIWSAGPTSRSTPPPRHCSDAS